jgi:hypothetical protein
MSANLGIRTDSNQAELSIVGHLINRVKASLTDRAGARHSPPWEQRQAVRVGVLPPKIIYAPPEDEASDKASADDVRAEAESEQEEEVTQPDPPSDVAVLGFDFILEPDADEVELAIEVSLALYHPELPTRTETEERFAQLSEEETELQRAETEALGQEAAETNLDQMKRDDGGASARHETKRRRKQSQVPIQNAWRRREIHVGPISVPLRANGDHVRVSEEITAAIGEAVRGHFAEPSAARPFIEGVPRTIPVDALASDETYRAALAERADLGWEPAFSEPEVTVFAESVPGRIWLVSVSLTNDTEFHGRPFQDLALYDCQISARVQSGGHLVPQRFRLAPKDYRYQEGSEVIGHGRGCVAERDGENGIRSETLPLYYQPRAEPRTGHVPIARWSDLATDPGPVLSGVRDGMRRYDQEWQEWLANGVDELVRPAAEDDLAAFEDEIARFELGQRALEVDHDLLTAFQLANRVFAEVNDDRSFDSWWLFQLVYIVTHLPSLAARRHRDDNRFSDQLAFADVLWFPTGGGKTEAYLGLIVIAMFYDRLRGKSAGVTAWLKFPLRMLSVQQLARVLRVLVRAERIRQDSLNGAGDAFVLGYLVGGGNTPNSLRFNAGWWPGFEAAAKQVAEDPLCFDEHRLFAQCPNCRTKNRIGIDVDVEGYRILHVCRACSMVLPIVITDDEVYRFQPSVVIATVDKVTGFAHFGEFTAFSEGPRWKCPKHGYLSFGKCTAGDRCEHTARSYTAIEWSDPVPALMIQDEMHLIREELGAFSAHFEGMLAELQRGGPSQLPSKILAATATIEQFEDQLGQVYGRRPRSFPSQGFELSRSFYTSQTDDVRRIYLGIMPAGGGVAKVEVAAAIQVELLRAVHELQDDLGTARSIVRNATGVEPTDDELAALLFDYEVTLGYVNSKAHGAMVRENLGALNLQLATVGGDQVRHLVLTGEVTVSELAEAIDLIEDSSPATPRGDRLRALVGTSVISHGVDLERLNLMVMAGLPTTTADYIQATSRAGRSHVGLIVTVFDHYSKRESSTFTHFESTHRFLDRLVEPIPVNKYAKNAVDRTLPAIVVALLWDLARKPAYNGPTRGIKRTVDFRGWWNAQAANGLADELLRRIKATYRATVPDVNPAALEDRLVEAAERRWLSIEKSQMEAFNAEDFRELFREHVMTSLRDIDTPVDFGAMPNAARVYEAMFDREPD